tara:strand:- start:188 stop:601 length:414 start_codon:yes stop_codon:yes gene_type:complete
MNERDGCFFDFVESLNQQNEKGVIAALNFPHVTHADGKDPVVFRDGDTYWKFLKIQIEKMKEQGWCYSKIENLEKIFETENTSYSTIEFTRYTREGLKISSARGVWIATFRQNKWGMQMRSAYPTSGSVSFLGGQSK